MYKLHMHISRIANHLFVSHKSSVIRTTTSDNNFLFSFYKILKKKCTYKSYSSFHNHKNVKNHLIMIALSRLFLDLSRRYRHHPIFLHRKFSKNLPTDYRKVQRIKEKSAKKLTRKEKDKNMQKDNEANIRVCIIGGGVTPLYTAILLKQYKIIKSIRLVDTRDSSLEALTDLSQLETSPRIDYFREKDIKQALREANIVALMDETDVTAMTDRILCFCPDALVAVFARPVTATLAMVSEIFRCSGWWNPDRIVGSIATYSGRIEKMVAAILDLERASLSVPLTGGADAQTVVPLLSRALPFNQFTNTQRKTLLQSLRASDEEAKTAFDEGPSLSSGTAAAKLIINLAAGLSGCNHVIICAYVRSDVLPVCRFFTSELELGPEGIKRNFGLPKISAAELLMIEQAIPLINEHVDMAVTAVQMERTRTRTR
ncbi:PREDICTED: malate dehydrogenase, mitochondrial-like isoform X2 [Trachymyrmex septentrionalis]|uniref:malate dehydrogenase, mitochondrial-like isoform X2 n=1 Tax=Trachymyrmex septentrionalis TaxID=34720 RepID=UPI00084F600B|nr:PREDICTED: malate dehydrogenase, mitochondrial-like isoform X2 [Trachymyrmex septentrionalis]